jgi:hypothetical protein
MKKVKVLSLSFNPNYYDVKEFANASYDEVKGFIEKSPICAYSYSEFELDLSKDNEYKFYPDGAFAGDTSDCHMMWIKVCGD